MNYDRLRDLHNDGGLFFIYNFVEHSGNNSKGRSLLPKVEGFLQSSQTATGTDVTG